MGFKRCMAAAAVSVVAVGVVLGGGAGVAGADTAGITEFYDGGTYAFSPADWHGASDCAVDSPTVVHCFDTDVELDAYTSSPPVSSQVRRRATAQPDVSCSGWTKIWSGTSWTGTGLAFSDWGYPMNLGNYVNPVPWTMHSWFSDGQRSYSANNCGARVFTGTAGAGSSLYLAPNSHATSMSFKASSIELYAP